MKKVLAVIALCCLGCTESKLAVVVTVSANDAEVRLIENGDVVTVWPYISTHHFVCPPAIGDTVVAFNENFFGIDDWYIKAEARHE